ncbi:MAG: glycosyltransferase family 2 protein [Treponema sp.]|nr:glycosyltransferase family 2 protein [Treponema sp.]
MLSASIVIYNTSLEQINKVLESVSKSNCVQKLYIIDNSPSEDNQQFFNNSSLSNIIEYIPHENTGYGSSHNIAIKKAIECGSDYHVVLNPDIYFEENLLSELIQYMDLNQDAGYILPRVTYPDGELQYLCKLLPTPFDLIFRRFLPKTELIKKLNARYELHQSGYDKIINPPCLSGCFMFMRVSTLKKYNLLFDDSFFMYCEDFDLIRRIHKVAKTIYYPKVSIIHDHAKASYKSKKMLLAHIKSAIHYFNKWGWLFDKERKVMNKQILKELEDIEKK